MNKAGIITVFGVSALAGCTPPPPIPVEQAMTECRARIASAVESEVGVGVVMGGGKVRPSLSLGVDVDLAALNNPEKTYYDCVVSKSGKAPTEPLYPSGA